MPDENLVIRYLKGIVTKEERIQVEAWLLAKEENRKLFTQLAYIYQGKLNQKKAVSWDTHDALDKVEQRIQHNSARRRSFQTLVAAAVAFVTISLTVFLYLQKKVDASSQLITISSKDYLRKAYTLPDGTMVWLNAGSSLSYPWPYAKNERRVTLSGEAYFEVAENPKQPFVVHVDKGLDIQVLGTAFNVNAYADASTVQTTLVSGSVALLLPGKPAKAVLKPAEKAVYSRGSKMLEVTAIDVDRETDWMRHRLIFRDTPMKEVITRLSRFYEVEFDVRDREIGTYTFTGVFENRPLSQVLEYMTIASNIRYTLKNSTDKNSKKIIVQLSKPK